METMSGEMMRGADADGRWDDDADDDETKVAVFFGREGEDNRRNRGGVLGEEVYDDGFLQKSGSSSPSQ